MSPVDTKAKEELLTKAPADDPEEPLDDRLTGFNDNLAFEVLEFRGTRYKLQELPIGEYDEITERATRKEARVDPDTGENTEVEVLDRQLQSRMMLTACIVEPAGVKISKLGTRLTVALNGVVNRLHYGDEPDGLAAKKKAAKPEEDGDGAKGKG